MAREPLHFDVSTGLKTVLGRELITDDAVAIFEMVKNSFDARATTVHLYFDDDCILVADNGSGMSFDDLTSKWLRVAYSEKRHRSEKDFRDAVAARGFVAGSKGIGRFSSDRLGKTIILQTRPAGPSKKIHKLTVDWTLFEQDDKQKFESIPVRHEEVAGFTVPSAAASFAKSLTHGTIIEIRGLRHPWSRDNLQNLKSSLAKLINPYGSDVDKFAITITAPAEKDADNRYRLRARNKGEEPSDRDIINGRVGNFIFSALQEKTTYLTVRIEGGEIYSSLVDRGELVYEIKEPSPYSLLDDAGFRAQVFYLNASAKLTFARRVGIPSVQFGSVFLFRNGFRIFPIGEPDDDWFGFNRRKQQGYSRYLGSRELIGRVDVFGAVGEFEEASSRNQGLIDNPAVQELKACVMDHCVKRLEKYVVPVSWPDKGDASSEDISRLLTDPGRARVSAAIANLVDKDDGIELLGYSKRLVSLINERSENFEGSLQSLRSIAKKTGDKKLLKDIDAAKTRFDELTAAEAEARAIADRERAVALEATGRAEKAEQEVELERRRSLFLDDVASVEVKQLLNLQHQVNLYSVEVNQLVENLLVDTEGMSTIPRERVLLALEQVVFLNRRIQAVSRLVASANFKLDSGKVTADLAAYLADYIVKVARISGSRHTKVTVENTHPGFTLKFSPMDAAIVVDNLISNAKKHHAPRLTFNIEQDGRSGLLMTVTDTGPGLKKGVNKDRIFEMGYGSSDGSGLGLYHVRQVLGEMNGTIELAGEQPSRGLRFVVRISRLGNVE